MARNQDTLESAVEGDLRRRVEAMGGRCEKFIPDYARGFPDRIVILPGGILVWVELKRPVGGRLAPAQLIAHHQLKKLGQEVRVIWNQEQVKSFIQEMCERMK